LRLASEFDDDDELLRFFFSFSFDLSISGGIIVGGCGIIEFKDEVLGLSFVLGVSIIIPTCVI
jgi:hypothetical protein